MRIPPAPRDGGSDGLDFDEVLSGPRATSRFDVLRESTQRNLYLLTTLPRWMHALLCTICIIALVLLIMSVVHASHGDQAVRFKWKNTGDFPWVRKDGSIDIDRAPINDALRIVPRLPSKYASIAAVKYIVVLGDALAAAAGVSDTHQAWTSIMRVRYFAQAQVLNFAQSVQRCSQLATQFAAFNTMFPTGLDGPAIVFVSCGMDSLLDDIQAQASAPSTHAAALDAFVVSLTGSTSTFAHGLYIYIMDYPDATDDIGWVSVDDVACAAPLDVALNGEGGSGAWVHALHVHSAALARIAAKRDVAFVPLNFLFQRTGFNRALLLDLPPSIFPTSYALFFTDCTLLNVAGQSALADILAAYVKNEPVVQYI